MQGVSRQQGYGNPPYVGVGIIILPFKQNREKYIKQCYRSRRVNIMLETGTVVTNCNVAESAIQDIKFPQDYKSLGSHVIYVTERVNQVPYIIGVLDKIYDRVSCEEHSFNLSRDTGNSRVNLIGKANGELYINVESKDGSKIRIDSTGEGSEVELNCDGKIKINGGDSVDINSTSEVNANFINSSGVKDSRFTISERGLKYEDNDENVFEVDKERGIINNFGGEQPIPKGTELQNQLDTMNKKLKALYQAIISATITPSDGGASFKAYLISAISQLQDADFSDINSDKTFTD